jgi:hypothetical protein
MDAASLPLDVPARIADPASHTLACLIPGQTGMEPLA